MADKINGYEIEASLGSGAFGRTYRVRKGGKVYAMKVLKPEAIRTEVDRKRFQRECRALQKIDRARRCLELRRVRGQIPQPHLLPVQLWTPAPRLARPARRKVGHRVDPSPGDQMVAVLEQGQDHLAAGVVGIGNQQNGLLPQSRQR